MDIYVDFSRLKRAIINRDLKYENELMLAVCSCLSVLTYLTLGVKGEEGREFLVSRFILKAGKQHENFSHQLVPLLCTRCL